jgi:cell wall-associated NlpC family hydrolase
MVACLSKNYVSVEEQRSSVKRWGTALVFALTAAAVVVPSSISSAQTGRIALPHRTALAHKTQPSLSSLVTRAKQLSFDINALSEQYDGLRIQLASARRVARSAELTASRDDAMLQSGHVAVAQLAQANFENAGLDPALQLLTSGNPQKFLSQASIVDHLNQQSDDRVGALRSGLAVAERAQQTAQQQIAAVSALETEMNAKTSAIQSKIAQINSAAMAKATAVFEQTGTYPSITNPLANTVGAEALQAALTRRGDPYVWAEAGPSEFDCSGLVVWAFAQEGITLPHYTGSLWNSGEHVSRSQLEPGDLVFFFADISHVGIYIGNGLMIDAPTFGADVRVDPVSWDAYVGAVRIG